MADEQGLIQFPGFAKIIRGSFTLSRGTKPSVASIETTPEIGFVPAVGTLQITFGSTTISFPNCRPSAATLRRSREGWVWDVSILDRRWKWDGLGTISGHYNERTRQGKLIKPGTKKTPKELATLCFEALGETNYDLSLLPNANNPEVNWDATTPADALQDLLEKVGALLVLQTNNVVKLWPIGQGADLPTAAVMNDQFTFDPPEKPDSLRFVGAPIKYQAKFRLEAVGRDTDGTIKLIDDLSYRPATGWQTPGLFAEVVDVDARKLAKATVFRYYRAKAFLNGEGAGFGGTFSIPDLVTITAMDDIVLLDELTQTVEDPQTGEEKPLQPFVIGAHLNGEFFQASTDTTERTQPSIRILPDTNLIEFSEPIYGADTTSGATGATAIYLETAFHVKDSTTHAVNRYELDRDIGGGLGTKPKIIKHDEVIQTKRAVYTGVSVTSVVTNDTSDQVVAYANLYLDGEQAKYETVTPQDRSFAGIFDISPDGAIAQIAWDVSRSGSTTRASRGTEHSVIVPNYDERQRIQKAKAVAARTAPVQRGGPSGGPRLQITDNAWERPVGLPIN